MKTRRLPAYIIGGFILGTITLVIIQYITTNNVKTLISGNEKLLQEFVINNELTDLQKDLLVLDNTLKSAVISGDSSKMLDFGSRLVKIQDDIRKLKNINGSDNTRQMLIGLESLVNQKMQFTRQVADSLQKSNRKAAENLIATHLGNLLSDSITSLTQKIDTSGQIRLSQTLKSIDQTGDKVLTWNYYIIGIVLLLFTSVFWIILNRMKKQTDLISQLNVSEAKLREAALVKENFLANMSHEIRTPLNAIIGYTNLLQRKNLDSDSNLYVSTVQKSGENLLSIVNDILDLSKIEAGMMRIEETDFSLRELVHSIEIMFTNKIENKGLAFTSFIEANVPDLLNGDPTRLTQILVNLIGNAVKFTQAGRIELHISGKSENDIFKTEFKVSDTGIGIEMDKIGHIFDRFSQAEDSITRKYGGTGLGLSIVRDLVNLQNGRIEVESTVGSGTNVVFSIPYQVSLRHFHEESVANSSENEWGNDCLNILVVEDNVINQSLLAHIFRNHHIKHSIVNNGAEALEILPAGNFDLILMDIQMPVMDGYTATKEIRQNLKMSIPIIAMTAHAMAGQREKCISFGMNDHIFKPIQENDLHRMIARYLGEGATQKRAVRVDGPVKNPPPYEVIDLTYLKEISNGDIDYEKVVTSQFLDLIPKQLTLMQEAIIANDQAALRKTVHNLKTSISIMGLDALLNEHLDALEYQNLQRSHIAKKADIVSAICQRAMEEATRFFRTL